MRAREKTNGSRRSSQKRKSLRREMGHQHQLLKRDCHALTYDFKKIYILAAVLKRDSGWAGIEARRPVEKLF